MVELDGRMTAAGAEADTSCEAHRVTVGDDGAILFYFDVIVISPTATPRPFIVGRKEIKQDMFDTGDYISVRDIPQGQFVTCRDQR